MGVAGVGVGVNSECLESVVDMCGDDDTSDHCLLGQEKLDMSGRGARREDILQARSLEEIVIIMKTNLTDLHQSPAISPTPRPACCSPSLS